MRSLKAIFVVIMALSLSSCITRKQIEATIWRNNAPVPQDLCSRVPELRDYGLYRKLDSGKLEFISVCNPVMRQMLSIHEKDLQKILDELLPKPEDRN